MIKIAYNQHLYNHPLPEGHRFPMIKYDLIPEQLLHTGDISREQLFEPEDEPEEVFLRVHEPSYLGRLKKGEVSAREERRFGFPWSQRLLEREVNICSGTLQCGLYALEYGAALNVAGGTHHAFPDRGEGFCILNDIAVGARYMLDEGYVNSVLCVDLDVHQGNGTAFIFEGDDHFYNFSMHGRSNFPFKKEQNDMDVALPDNYAEEAYLKDLAFFLEESFNAARPDMIFFQSGVDILECDKLGKLNVSPKGIKARDEMVIKKASRLGLPLVAVMGGGYSENIAKIVDAHCNTFKTVMSYY